MSQSPSNGADGDALFRYRRAWSAINALLEGGGSLSGRERNCAFLNTGGTRFADISAASGLDLLDDGRGVALVDWDHDGKVDLFTTNRTAPFIRLMNNQSVTGNRFLAVRLRGKTCNRDAIGARLELHLAPPGDARGGAGVDGAGPTRIYKTLRAGEGFVAQSSKWIVFGLGNSTKIERLIVRWPGAYDAPQIIENLSADLHYTITQGTPAAQTWQPPPKPTFAATPPPAAESTGQVRVFLATRAPLPRFSYRDMTGKPQSVPHAAGPDGVGKPMLLNLWATWCPPCVVEMKEWAAAAADLKAANVTVLSLSVDALHRAGADGAAGSDDDAKAKAHQALERMNWPHLAGMATTEAVRAVDLLCRSLVDKPMQMVVPTSLLLDSAGRVAVIYRGPVTASQVIEDQKLLVAGPAERLKQASHGPGRWFSEPPDTGINALIRQLVQLDGPRTAEAYLQQVEADTDSQSSDANRKAMLVEAHTDVATGFRTIRVPDKAVFHYKQALEHSPGHARVRMELAMLLTFIDKHEEALPHLEAVLKANPADQFARQQLVQSLFTIGKVGQSLEHVEAFIKAHPEDPVGHVFRAKALLARGRGPEAIASYREALRLKPGWIVAMNELAWQLSTNPDDKVRSSKAALELAQDVVARTSRREPMALDTLAAAHAEAGEYDKAMKIVEEALRLCRASGNKALADKLETRLPKYADKIPWREATPKPTQ